MTSVEARIDIDQGGDWATQIYVTDSENHPMLVVGPMRMEIRNEVGGVAVTLQTDETSEDQSGDVDNQSISYNTESGLIQLYLSAKQTALMAPGQYSYDLFIHFSDPIMNKVRKRKLIGGTVSVTGRVTQNV